MTRSEFSKATKLARFRHAKECCETCGTSLTDYYTLRRAAQRGYGYCSRACSATAIAKKTLAGRNDRFMSRIDKRGDCWIFTGRINKTGYGVFDANGRPQLAHRYMWTLRRGDPGRLFVCHSCDNPRCVNPSHLWLGTAAANVRDMISKGRNSRLTVRTGAAVNTAKLSKKDVLIIRTSKEPSRVLAATFGVTRAQINNIRSGRQWKHV